MRARLHRGEPRRREEAASFPGERQRDDDMVGLAQHGVEIGERRHGSESGRQRAVGRAAHAEHAHAERGGARRHGAAERAGADDGERLAGELEQRRDLRRPPLPLVLRAHQRRQLPREREHQGEHVLGDVDRVVAAAVGEHQAVARHQLGRRDPVDAGAALVQPLQARSRRRGSRRSAGRSTRSPPPGRAPALSAGQSPSSCRISTPGRASRKTCSRSASIGWRKAKVERRRLRSGEAVPAKPRAASSLDVGEALHRLLHAFLVAQARVLDAAEGRELEPVARHLADVDRADLELGDEAGDVVEPVGADRRRQAEGGGVGDAGSRRRWCRSGSPARPGRRSPAAPAACPG